MFKLVIFDLDGTLIDSCQDITLCLNMTLRDFGKPQVESQTVRRYIGSGARALLEKFFPPEDVDKALEVFRGYYRQHPVVYTRPYEGIPEALEFLRSKGVIMTVVTNKMEEISYKILDTLKLLDYFSLVVGGDTYHEKKPSALPIIKTLEKFSVKPKESLIVGDTEADILSGKRASVYTALALWGYTKDMQEEPDFILNTPTEIIELWNSRSTSRV
ncbi:HAD family hydrolase [Thermocrinis minervae]|uniref:phosphoglycolate phosphatase n=1 Tax=Thermocrinis minervae TaxID=381751 RepID=A0A1M6R3E4_9AQUI|nr:HAD-IA family hydrolase [Thermocrinis minervae]SHK26867.1 phosphoglycolate phosphatase [Thermocrinis minervae]